MYSKLFDRLKPDEVLTVISTATCIENQTPDEITEGGGDCALSATANTATSHTEHTTVSHDGGSACPSGWNETWEVPGREDLCSVNMVTDVGEYIMEYTEITEAVANELSIEEGEGINTNFCESFDIAT